MSDVVFRGIGINHPGASLARQGRVTPRGGDASPLQHNLGDTHSPYSSWSTSREFAAIYAGEDGIVLELDLNKVAGRWDYSPDLFGEFEILVEGDVSEAVVI